MKDPINELLSSLAETLDGFVARRIEEREKMAEQFEAMPLGEPGQVEVPASLPLSLRVGVLEKQNEARAMGQEHIGDRLAALSQRLCSLEENAPPLDASAGGFPSRMLERIEALESKLQSMGELAKNLHGDKERRIQALERGEMGPGQLVPRLLERVAQLEERAGVIPKEAYTAHVLSDWLPANPSRGSAVAERLSGPRLSHLPPPSTPQPQRVMTMLEQIQRERELNQKALLDIQLAKSDREELERYRNHNPSGKPRYGTPEYEAAQQREKARQKTMAEMQQAANEQLKGNMFDSLRHAGFVDT